MGDSFFWLCIAAALALFFYIARDYPQWKADRVASQQQLPQPAEGDSKDENSTDSATTESSPWPEKFSVRWIPYLPFALVYLLAKAAWACLRVLVLHSLFIAEHAGYALMSVIEDIVQWSVNNGPEFIQNRIISPLQTAAVAFWESPALAKIKSMVEETLFPAILRALISAKTFIYVTAFQLYAWIQRMVEPVTSALMWFTIQCIIAPGKAVWSRLEILGLTFLQTAKIYLHELAKDAVDLGWFVAKAGKWIYARTLRPIGGWIYSGAAVVIESLVQFLPWLAQKIYSGLIRPMASTIRDGFTIIRSHPTLLAGLQALSSKVQEKVALALQKLEGVNWLLLIEEVLTKGVLFTYRVLSLVASKIGQGLQILFVDIIPNVYTDLMMALEFARPIVAWAINKVVTILHPLWQLVSWISWTVYANTRPTLAWAHQKLVLPSIAFWNTTLFPIVTALAAMIVRSTKRVADNILRVMPWISSISAPIWGMFVRILAALQLGLTSALTKIGVLSGGLSERIQKQVKVLAPQVENFKAYVGHHMDEAVLTASNFMMDWVKQEKRD
ncbi:hypothetical protein EMPS_05416 [Entomortierella parvispora]|uniref:Uncharacterized protein n=1 Tax=Entomortierella parvispora TaxID=205924 RepID=A0A9P3LWG7_9FUNG|nr:hypothetical protein EMPS_05416 [Entomortierella parvispora]